MNNNEFESLAERVLLSMVQGQEQSDRHTAERAIEVADAFASRLAKRRHDALKDGKLLPEEIRCIEDGNAIHAIKLVRERTGMNLKDSKALVDQERARLGL